ncbi:AMP-binding protein, partial [Pseudomonas protegens]|uniref:AMP-binding protein n=1 Tax=Pseudomonas protegens TaxID=380021 RepID=UPI0011CED100
MPAAWLEQFAQWLKSAAAHSDLPLEQLPLVGHDQAQRLLRDFDRSAQLVAADAPLLHQLFEEAARAFPERVAIHVDGQEVTYGELDRQANQLAHSLRQQGVASDAIAGVYGARSIEIVVALLGILKAGGAYLPLDPAYPSERLSFMLEDAEVRCLITLQPLHPDILLPANLPQVTLNREMLSGNIEALQSG